MNFANFFQKLLFARQLKVKEGYLEIYGIPYVFFPAESFTTLVDSIIEISGKKGKIKLYKEGIKVGKNIAKVFEKKMGVKGEELMDAIFKIGGLGGWGTWKFYRKDFHKKFAIIHARNIATAKYRFLIKKRKEPSCHLLRGIMVGEAREIWNDQTLEAIETKCISQGWEFCEFIIQKRKKFNKKNKFVKTQLDI